jgi:hypothetical protein
MITPIKSAPRSTPIIKRIRVPKLLQKAPTHSVEEAISPHVIVNPKSAAKTGLAASKKNTREIRKIILKCE